ncbi:arginine--tRNA ligase [Anaerotignum propionicum]|uniref:Arginine--tRNA ligase n=2 Tax=Anaerotignum propionicum TaxID=28446 RepID=A0AA94L430_ANAPI|nr:arginine--tRNA ligase [Anaerotignum propionicum]SHE31410.1 arginyl-tRNA synthetase [[Clostridium] propionicum DSM 1682] [Anaerotignum propionicum DSM 1682]
MDFKMEVAGLLAKATELSLEDALNTVEIPGNKAMGDFAFPCFRLAKVFRKAPPMIAQEVAEKLDKPAFIENIQVVGAYINFFVKKGIYAQEILSKVLAEKENYGKSDIGAGKTVVIDYSSPNIAKPFHVGHLRSTVIGNAIYKIYEALGYNCEGVNHLGDWGTQFGKLIVAYHNWGSKEAVENQGIQELMRIYVKFHDEAEKNPALDDEARLWFVKMQEGDEEALTLWKWFYDISIKEFERVYKMLGVKFDAYTGESFYNDKMAPVVEELKAKNILKESEGAMIVDLEHKNMAPCLIIRKDGGTLYATRDITAALYRKKTYNFDKCIILTALDQNLHFAQWFEVIHLMGYDWYKDLIHVPFGLVSLDSGKLSTRHGNVILMEDLLNQAIGETKKIIEEKNPSLENKEEVAKQVGIGAVIFNDLYNGRIKDVVFSWERMLNFDGETGPYVQYTHARACSILKRAGEISLDDIHFDALSDEASLDICKLLEAYPEKIKDAANKLEPSVVTRHLVAMAQAFNKFYHDNPILNSEEDVRQARLAVVVAVKTVMKEGLSLLGIDAPEQM